MAFCRVSVACIILTLAIPNSNGEASDVSLTPQGAKNSNKSPGLSILTPTGSAFDNTNLTIKDGVLAYVVSAIHALDVYVLDPTGFGIVFNILNTPGVNKVGLVKLLEGLVQFVKDTDFKFVDDGLENNAINCLKDLRL